METREELITDHIQIPEEDEVVVEKEEKEKEVEEVKEEDENEEEDEDDVDVDEEDEEDEEEDEEDALHRFDATQCHAPHSGRGMAFIEAIPAEEEEAKDQRRQYGDSQ